MGNVLVVGSANLDLVVDVSRLPMPGETIGGASTRTEPGGKGLNQAIAAARFGARTRFVGCVGADVAGLELRTALTSAGIDTSGLRTSTAATGSAVVVVEESGENLIVVAPGANAEVELDPDTHPSPPDVALFQLEVPLTAVLRGARSLNPATQVVMNLAPAPSREAATGLGLAADVVIVNEHEAAAIGDMRAVDAGAARLAEQFDAAVVVTLGAGGAIVADRDGTRRIASHVVASVSTVGAGDAFCGVLAAALSDGLGLDDAVALGCAAGALATTVPGTANAMPHRADVLALAARTVK